MMRRRTIQLLIRTLVHGTAGGGARRVNTREVEVDALPPQWDATTQPRPQAWNLPRSRRWTVPLPRRWRVWQPRSWSARRSEKYLVPVPVYVEPRER
jgi:hypothetical protein